MIWIYNNREVLLTTLNLLKKIYFKFRELKCFFLDYIRWYRYNFLSHFYVVLCWTQKLPLMICAVCLICYARLRYAIIGTNIVWQSHRVWLLSHFGYYCIIYMRRDKDTFYRQAQLSELSVTCIWDHKFTSISWQDFEEKKHNLKSWSSITMWKIFPVTGGQVI